MKNRAIRLFTLLCFFQFSGLGNGFACLSAAAGPLQVGPSLALAGTSFGSVRQAVSLKTTLSPLQKIQGSLIRWTLQFQESAAGITLRPSSFTLQESRPIPSGLKAPSGRQILAQKSEAWNKKESADEEIFTTASPRFAALVSGRTRDSVSFMKTSLDFKAGRALYRILQFGGSDGSDAAPDFRLNT